VKKKKKTFHVPRVARRDYRALWEGSSSVVKTVAMPTPYRKRLGEVIRLSDGQLAEKIDDHTAQRLLPGLGLLPDKQP
jgi:hypothetical protein